MKPAPPVTSAFTPSPISQVRPRRERYRTSSTAGASRSAWEPGRRTVVGARRYSTGAVHDPPGPNRPQAGRRAVAACLSSEDEILNPEIDDNPFDLRRVWSVLWSRAPMIIGIVVCVTVGGVRLQLRSGRPVPGHVQDPGGRRRRIGCLRARPVVLELAGQRCGHPDSSSCSRRLCGPRWTPHSARRRTRSSASTPAQVGVTELHHHRGVEHLARGGPADGEPLRHHLRRPAPGAARPPRSAITGRGPAVAAAELEAQIAESTSSSANRELSAAESDVSALATSLTGDPAGRSPRTGHPVRDRSRPARSGSMEVAEAATLPDRALRPDPGSRCGNGRGHRTGVRRRPGVPARSARRPNEERR